MKAFMGIVVLAALVVGVMFMLRAAGVPGAVRGKPRYDIHMANRTHFQLDDVGVYYGNQVAALKGLLVKGGCASYGKLTKPIPETATVTWTEADGIHHAPRVKLAGIIPACPRDMNIWFIIEEDNSVTVECVSSNDRAANDGLFGTLVEVRKKPGRIEDLLVGAKPLAGTADRFSKPGNVCIAQSQFDSVVGDLQVTKHPDGSESAILLDGTSVTVRARNPDGGFDIHATGIIRAKLSTGKEIEIRYGSG